MQTALKSRTAEPASRGRRLFSGLSAAILLFFSLTGTGWSLSREQAGQFVLAAASGGDSLDGYVLPEELRLSQRLGISYQGVPHKFMIGYDLDPQIKRGILDRSLDYEVRIENPEDDFFSLQVQVPQRNYRRLFYFKGSFLVSPVYYHTRGWSRIQTKHFSFLLSDPGYFNGYSASRLESFLEGMLEVLDFREKEKEKLAREKIIYAFCANDGELEKLTGFRAQGMAILAGDCVASTFNCHYHELVHLLINYRLGRPALYTHPFFQEGLAVALGGRGGKEPEVLLDLGYFVLKSELTDYRTLLSGESFASEEPSISYPACGLYNHFLLGELGLERYLDLYRKYSGTGIEALFSAVDEKDLPPKETWEKFLDSYCQNRSIYLSGGEREAEPFWQDRAARVYRAGESYFFRLADTLTLSARRPEAGYKSAKFHELAPSRNYLGENYLITADGSEIKLYNLLTNNLAASLSSQLTFPEAAIPAREGFIEFYVRKSVFDQPLEEMIIRTN